MRCTLWLTLGLASSAMADGPAFKGVMTSLNTALLSLDKSIKAITATNVATQVTDVSAKLTDLAKTMTESSSRLKSSKPLGMTDAFSLMTPIQNIAKTIQSLLTDGLDKREIIVSGGQTEILAQTVRKIQPAVNSFTEAMLTQMPAGAMPAGSSSGAGITLNPAEMNKLSDSFFNAAIAIFKGEASTVEIPKGLWPLKGGAAAPKGKASAAPKKANTLTFRA